MISVFPGHKAQIVGSATQRLRPDLFSNPLEATGLGKKLINHKSACGVERKKWSEIYTGNGAWVFNLEMRWKLGCHETQQCSRDHEDSNMSCDRCSRATIEVISLCLPMRQRGNNMLVTVAVQPGMCFTWSETPTTHILMSRLTCFLFVCSSFSDQMGSIELQM